MFCPLAWPFNSASCGGAPPAATNATLGVGSGGAVRHGHGGVGRSLRVFLRYSAVRWIYYKLRLHYMYTSQDDKITSDALSRCRKNQSQLTSLFFVLTGSALHNNAYVFTQLCTVRL